VDLQIWLEAKRKFTKENEWLQKAVEEKARKAAEAEVKQEQMHIFIKRQGRMSSHKKWQYGRVSLHASCAMNLFNNGKSQHQHNRLL
jgi:hypothetical protein